MDGSLTPWEFARRLLPFKDVEEVEVVDRLLTHRAQLWVTDDSAGVTEITDGNMLRIWLVGGKLMGLLPMLQDVERFARFMRCRGLEIDGRGGWIRVLKKFGYAVEGQELVKWL